MKTNEIPAIRVVQWQYRGLFGRLKVTWVLPPVKVGVLSTLDYQAIAIRTIGASEHETV